MTCAYDAPRSPVEGQTTPAFPEQWRGPNGYTLLSWEIDFRSGGGSRLCLRSSEGRDHWVDGVRLEIVEPERVVFTGQLGFAEGPVTFRRA